MFFFSYCSIFKDFTKLVNLIIIALLFFFKSDVIPKSEISSNPYTFDSFISRRKADYTKAYLKFIAILDAVDEKEKKTLLRNLVERTLPLRKLAKALTTTEEEFLDRISKIHPHPVYIHPATGLVTAGNFVANKEFKKQIKN